MAEEKKERFLMRVDTGRIFAYTGPLAEKPGMIQVDEDGNPLGNEDLSKGIDYWRDKCSQQAEQIASLEDRLAEATAMTEAMKKSAAAIPSDADAGNPEPGSDEKKFSGFLLSEIRTAVAAFDDKEKLLKFAEDEKTGLGIAVDARLGLDKMKANILEQTGAAE